MRAVPPEKVPLEVARVNLTLPQTNPFHAAGSSIVTPPTVALAGAVTVK